MKSYYLILIIFVPLLVTGCAAVRPVSDMALGAGGGLLANQLSNGNPGITAPIPGMVNTHQVDNAVLAVRERRTLDAKEKAELNDIGRGMWARLRPDHQWLRDWEYV